MLPWPTPIVPAGFPPITVMPVPVKAAEAIVTVPMPALVTVKLRVVVVPTATLPKLMLVTLGESTPAPGSEACVFAELVYAAQLERPAIARIMARVVIRTTGVDERLTVALSCELELLVRIPRSWLRALMSESV